MSVTVKAQVFYAFINRPNKMSGKYQIDLGQLSVAAQAALEEMGLEIKQKDLQGDFITCKSLFPIKLFDADGELIERPIGNGSEGVFEVTTYDTKTPQGQAMKGAQLNAGTITEFIEYGQGGSPVTSAKFDEAL